MTINLEKFKQDLNKLIAASHDLQLAMAISAYGEEEAKKALVAAGVTEAEIDKAQSGARSFNADYQAWYSESIAVLKQVLPDRLSDFKALYERPTNRKDISFVNYVMSDFLIGLQTSRYGDVIADRKSGIPKFQNQMAILAAAKTRFSSSLFEIRQLVQADLFDSEIDSARELLRKKFVRAAGAISGVVLEKHLKQVCDDHNVKIPKKNPSISDLNELLKSNAIIEIPQWRHITLLADIRNLCDHNKAQEPTETQVSDLIEGVNKVLKTIS
jgi:hypothetical protein